MLPTSLRKAIVTGLALLICLASWLLVRCSPEVKDAEAVVAASSNVKECFGDVLAVEKSASSVTRKVGGGNGWVEFEVKGSSGSGFVYVEWVTTGDPAKTTYSIRHIKDSAGKIIRQL